MIIIYNYKLSISIRREILSYLVWLNIVQSTVDNDMDLVYINQDVWFVDKAHYNPSLTE